MQLYPLLEGYKYQFRSKIWKFVLLNRNESPKTDFASRIIRLHSEYKHPDAHLETSHFRDSYMHITEHCRVTKQLELQTKELWGMLKEQAIDSNMHLTLILGLTHTFLTTTNQQDRHKVSNTKQALHLNWVVLLSSTFQISYKKIFIL